MTVVLLDPFVLAGLSLAAVLAGILAVALIVGGESHEGRR